MRRVTAVVVHWRDADETRGCIESLSAEPDLGVVVVDNGSRPPLGPLAAVTTIRSEETSATRAARIKLACFLAASLPLQLRWQWPRGGAGEVWLKVRGIRDGLLGRRPPFEALGLR